MPTRSLHPSPQRASVSYHASVTLRAAAWPVRWLRERWSQRCWLIALHEFSVVRLAPVNFRRLAKIYAAVEPVWTSGDARMRYLWYVEEIRSSIENTVEGQSWR